MNNKSIEPSIGLLNRIICQNLYMTIATVDTNCLPSATPVFFATDETFRYFYWISSLNAIHSINISNNQKISIVIFDSTIKHGDGIGVYASGVAEPLYDLDEITKADNFMKIKLGIKDERTADYYCSPNPRRMYKFVYDQMWINMRTLVGNQWVDKRQIVNISI